MASAEQSRAEGEVSILRAYTENVRLSQEFFDRLVAASMLFCEN